MSFNPSISLPMDNIYSYGSNSQYQTEDQQQRLTVMAMQEAEHRPQLLPKQQQPQLYNSHVATAAGTIFSSLELAVENVMPGIYLTKNFIAWNEDNLHSHGFTHIIIIDKHIQELYYPSPIFKLSTQAASSDIDAFEYICHSTSPPSLCFSKEFEAIDLNFGEKSYLTTVLPNCYRAVKFINKALQVGGTILVIDCNGGEQKCLTIIVAYLMYKHNINFSNAFARLKVFYKKADLDRFYMSQLYEYEPILQVQRAQSRGHSCSRELHAAILKRKNVDDDLTCVSDMEECGSNVENSSNELFDTLNPLSHFKTTRQQEHTHYQRQPQIERSRHMDVEQQPQQLLTTPYTNGFNTWDDYAME